MRAAGLVSLGDGRGTALGTAGEAGTTTEAVLLALLATRTRRPCRISARYMRLGYVLSRVAPGSVVRTEQDCVRRSCASGAEFALLLAFAVRKMQRASWLLAGAAGL